MLDRFGVIFVLQKEIEGQHLVLSMESSKVDSRPYVLDCFRELIRTSWRG